MAVKESPSLAKELLRAKADSKLLEKKYQTIARRHKNRWVGVYNEEFLYADTLSQLISKAQEKGWSIASMVVAHLEPKRGALLLRVGDSGILQ